jgi:glycyl-tRNA synthetase beta chain
VEIVCEELPAGMVRGALTALRDGVVGLLEGIEHGEVKTYATPRRIAVSVAGVAPARPRVQRTVLGPPADRAFDAKGAPTSTGIGFAKGKGVDPSALVVADGPKGKVAAVAITEGGETVVSLVGEGLDAVLRSIPFAKSMEWGFGAVRWGRPIHRVNVVYDGRVVAGRAVDLWLGGETVGHRLAPETAFGFRDGASWLAGLRARGVEPDLDARAAKIRALLDEARDTVGGADPIDDEALVEEVVHLVEAPTLVVSAFDEELLALPPRLLVETMKKNQRTFPLLRDGRLTNRFAVITNNPWGDGENIAKGNAAVVRARFDDARFFLKEDGRKRLEEHGLRLAQMRWIRDLGTVADKQQRTAALAALLAPIVGADLQVVARAGALAKCDLATQLVGEFPTLQGHVGKLYALAQGEPEAAAVAIEEAWMPRGADDRVAATPAGRALALADRLDTLVACFGIGLVPTGGGDPQGLRRAAHGVLRTLIEHGTRADLRVLAAAARRVLDESALPNPPASVVDDVVEFVLTRFKATRDVTGDLVDAVVAASPPDPVVLDAKVRALAALAGHAEFRAIMTTFKRVLNITRDQQAPPPSAAQCTHEAERTLLRAVDQVEGKVAEAVAALDFPRALDHVLVLRGPVADLFDAVLVDAPDPAERAVRMGLLSRVARIFLTVADFGRISTR